MMDYNEMKKLSQEALNDPKPGDYWQEMYSWHMYVLEVEETDSGWLFAPKVKIITTISASSPCEFPSDGKLQKRTHAEFKTWLSYGSIEGTWAHCNKRNANIDWWKPQPPSVPATSESMDSSNPCNRLSNELKTLKERYEKLEKENEELKKRAQRILDDVAGVLINHVELDKEKELKNE
jgi:hypothetical protein